MSTKDFPPIKISNKKIDQSENRRHEIPLHVPGIYQANQVTDIVFYRPVKSQLQARSMSTTLRFHIPRNRVPRSHRPIISRSHVSCSPPPIKNRHHGPIKILSSLQTNQVSCVADCRRPGSHSPGWAANQTYPCYVQSSCSHRLCPESHGSPAQPEQNRGPRARSREAHETHKTHTLNITTRARAAHKQTNPKQNIQLNTNDTKTLPTTGRTKIHGYTTQNACGGVQSRRHFESHRYMMMRTTTNHSALSPPPPPPPPSNPMMYRM